MNAKAFLEKNMLLPPDARPVPFNRDFSAQRSPPILAINLASRSDLVS
jgi:hypothetical protein